MNQRAAYVGRGKDDYVEVGECTIGHDGANATHIHFEELADDDNAGWHWIPHSQIEKLTRTHQKGTDKARISKWIARKIGLDV